MTAHALLFTIAAIGISETAYLIRSRRHDQKPVCVLGRSCSIVLESKYNRIFGIHNDILGFLFYIKISIILGLIVAGVGPLDTWNMIAKASIGFAAVFSVFLVYLQKFVIKAWCFWCLMSAFTIWLMALILILTKLV
ncbi:vitamin K epoxide reductase family protein [Candidatus Peregrinibacteria bacterium]|nr:vitamin K epoxide reductase family protein [Candidatus Peregrinibacteria bacterium]